jgi:predicted DsbA family dithiol-disulfide isomerase
LQWPPAWTKSFLASSEGAEEVSEAEIASQRSGLNGVPTSIIKGPPGFSGALHAELMLAHLIKAVGLS